MNDRELLELAAKAAGLGRLVWWEDQNCYQLIDQDGSPRWNPLTDDGDALRLSVILKIDICHSSDDSHCWLTSVFTDSVTLEVGGATEMHGDDPFAATRRAIVRAAAEIGSQMK